MRSFDVVVVGGGPSGEEAAGRLGERGLEVAIVEDRLIGGECAYWACMPSKALLRPYEALQEARRLPGAREAVNGELDVPALFGGRDEVIEHFDDSKYRSFLESRGVTVLRGRGRLAGERRVTIGDEEIEARQAVVLAGGSLPLLPPIEGLHTVEGPWTNREATTANEVPERLLIIGGGPVGVEMAQAFRTFGSHVTLVEGARRLLPREEEFACAQVTTALEEHGVDIRTGIQAERISQSGGTITVTTADGGTAEGDVLLVALGRRAPTDDLGVETVGLTPGDFIEVDAQMRVAGTSWLYAVGDINGRTQQTHMGKYQGRLAADHIAGLDNALSHGADGTLAPRVIFTDPQIAAVGHTTDSARDAGADFDVYDTELSSTDAAAFYSPGAAGTARFLVDRGRRTLIGCTITGSEIADFLHAATIAVVGELPLERLRHAVPTFPTRSEIWLALLEQAGA